MATPLQEWSASLAALLERAPRADDLKRASDPELIDIISSLERAKSTISASQAHAEITFRDSQVELQRRQDVPRALRGRGVADQIAMARRITPTQASDQVALHRVLIETLPRTTSLLERGEISEWAAQEVAKNVFVLDDDKRAEIDAELEPRLPALTATRTGNVTRARAQELDPAAAVARAKRAVADRRASLRPAPDGMSIFRAVLPTKDGVAVYKTLTQEAKSAKSSGDERSKGQIMADTLVERVTGAKTVDEIPVEVNLLMTDMTLLNDDDRTAWMDGHPIPGRLARDIALGVASKPAGIRRSPDPEHTESSGVDDDRTAADQEHPINEDPLSEGDATRDADGGGSLADGDAERDDEPSDQAGPEPAVRQAGPELAARDEHSREPDATTDPESASVDPERPPGLIGPSPDDLTNAARWIRRLYTDPRTGELTAADPRRRLFRGEVRRFIMLRDQRCRTPWCDAAIHDIDHATRYEDGGETTADNGIGHCQRFNLVKEIPGWKTTQQTGADGEPSTLTITTPTGHRYTSSAPALQSPVDPAPADGPVIDSAPTDRPPDVTAPPDRASSDPSAGEAPPADPPPTDPQPTDPPPDDGEPGDAYPRAS